MTLSVKHILENFVRLDSDVPKRLHFNAWRIIPKEITDPHTKSPKIVNVLQLDVDQDDGIRVHKVYSITSEKHAQQIAPYLQNNSYLNFDFSITMRGHGFLREYTVQIIPRIQP